MMTVELADVMPSGTPNPAASTPGTNDPATLKRQQMVRYAVIGGGVLAVLGVGFFLGRRRRY
jgi:hypothetical protein